MTTTTTMTTTIASLLLILLASASVVLLFVPVCSCSSTITLPFGRIRIKHGTHSGTHSTSTNDAPSSSWTSRVLRTPRAGGGAAPASFVAVAQLPLPTRCCSLEPLSYYLRVALAGGLAGATGSAVLYPIDSAKTLRQSNPTAYNSVKDALFAMLRSENALRRVYSGILPAALGAIPSSALYFGAYESSKVALKHRLLLHGMTKGVSNVSNVSNSNGNGNNTRNGNNNIDNNNNYDDYRIRLAVHGLAAASGNVISSFVFVPKEVIKQQLQIRSTSAASVSIKSIVREKGISGLYAGYGATLLRNIPSATIRFVLYEELKRKWATTSTTTSSTASTTTSTSTTERERQQTLRAAGTFLAGAVAGSASSFVMTPIDVVKTRMATGSCPLGVRSCMLHVVKEVGWKGLYAGAGSRVLWSGAFSAIGFGTFEFVKGYLGVGEEKDENDE